MKEFSRTQRVGEQIQRELASIIHKEVNTKTFGMITVSGVDVSPDLKQAKIYVTILAGDEKNTVEHLNTEMKGRLRHGLSQRLTTRTTPQLQFIHDGSVEYGTRLSALIESVKPKIDDDLTQNQ
ncbi:30S ribosome-binding factor RbfA [Candidatus Halobeggiatoa sp. HSG11]|nr:30S ribosome-binding factor RbfA [Candidatus Halobeggiatoa sp. HSG11]